MKSKNKEEKKMSREGIIYFMVVILVVLFGGGFVISKDTQVGKNGCLIDIAKSYCEEQGLVYSRVGWNMGTRFYCEQNLRISRRELMFFFLEHEEEECLE